jgi:CubicO group peptidase (beta-lactamase class C family)
MMYAGVGHAIELQSGKPWAEFVREKILQPLEMKSTVFSIADMLKQPDYGVPFTERRDSFELYKIPYYEEQQGDRSRGSDHFQHRRHVALADRPDEQWQVQRQTDSPA